jgi:hypothetical protein
MALRTRYVGEIRGMLLSLISVGGSQKALTKSLVEELRLSAEAKDDKRHQEALWRTASMFIASES